MSDSIIRPIPDRVEHLGSDLDGILRATGDGQPPTVAVPGEHYATPEALASGLAGKADLADATRVASLQYALSPIGQPIAWDSFRRPDSPTPIGPGSLGLSDSGHEWQSVYPDEVITGDGVNRPRYWKIHKQMAVVHSPGNAAYAISLVNDPRLALGVHDAIMLQSTRKSTLGMESSGLVLRFVDEENWITCGVLASGRGLGIRQRKNGDTSYLVHEVTAFHNQVGEHDAIMFRVTLGVRKQGVLGISFLAEGYGRAVRYDVRILESDDPGWFDALLNNDRVGINGGGEPGGVTGFAVGKVPWGGG